MKIVNVTATSHQVPTSLPHIDTPQRPMGVIVVRVETDAEITGFGMAPGNRLRGPIKDLINTDLAEQLKGKDPLDTERLWKQVYAGFSRFGAAGLVSTSLSAVDIALWDIKGKAYGQPVHRLLGGASDSAPAYATFGFFDYDREGLAVMAKELVGQGFDAMKMVVGSGNALDLDEDVRRIAGVREAVGPGVRLMIDANLLFDYQRALALAKRVEELNITWFEEPVVANDVNLMRDLRHATSIPIAAGQFEGTKTRHRELVQQGAVDFLHANVFYIGGYTEALKVAHLAQIYNLPYASAGGWPHHNMQLIAGIGGWGVEVHMSTWVAGETIFKDAPKPAYGKIVMPDAPGVGLTFNEDALKEYLEG